jgi:UDP-glucose 4-epimerase
MSWLVTGGAGYIGAHVVRALQRAGHDVAALDDLSTGRAERLPAGVRLVPGSVLDRAAVRHALRGVDAVVHLAAKKSVPESVAQPLLYWRENVGGLTTLLEECELAGVERFVFSSSAAVYGMPDVDLVREDTPCAPVNPYGETKLAGEWAVRACAEATGMRAALLRYFNVAGAQCPELADEGVFNLVPMLFERLQAGRPPRVFGSDYPTPDGTCVRDFVHVQDLAEAHVVAADALSAGAKGTVATYNIGRGRGASVREVVDVVAAVTGLPAEPQLEPRRPGDPARVVASVDRAGAELGFTAARDLRAMVESAWAGWVLRHGTPGGG